MLEMITTIISNDDGVTISLRLAPSKTLTIMRTLNTIVPTIPKSL